MGVVYDPLGAVYAAMGAVYARWVPMWPVWPVWPVALHSLKLSISDSAGKNQLVLGRFFARADVNMVRTVGSKILTTIGNT